MVGAGNGGTIDLVPAFRSSSMPTTDTPSIIAGCDGANRGRQAVDTSSEVLTGGAIPRLLEASAGADLHVLGSRRWAKLAHVVLGSVSEPVVRKSTCPTLVVPRRRRDRSGDGSQLTASARS
jgi:hypothetical protein